MSAITRKLFGMSKSSARANEEEIKESIQERPSMVGPQPGFKISKPSIGLTTSPIGPKNSVSIVIKVADNLSSPANPDHKTTSGGVADADNQKVA